jgi:hypothetical protein
MAAARRACDVVVCRQMSKEQASDQHSRSARTPDVGHDIRVEIRRGVTAITVSWPVSAAAECAAWMRDWLK